MKRLGSQAGANDGLFEKIRLLLGVEYVYAEEADKAEALDPSSLREMVAGLPETLADQLARTIDVLDLNQFKALLASYSSSVTDPSLFASRNLEMRGQSSRAGASDSSLRYAVLWSSRRAGWRQPPERSLASGLEIPVISTTGDSHHPEANAVGDSNYPGTHVPGSPFDVSPYWRQPASSRRRWGLSWRKPLR